MPTNLSADADLSQNVPARIEFENAMLVPLAQVKMLAVVAQI